jgi:hypothetical protein
MAFIRNERLISNGKRDTAEYYKRFYYRKIPLIKKGSGRAAVAGKKRIAIVVFLFVLMIVGSLLCTVILLHIGTKARCTRQCQ